MSLCNSVYKKRERGLEGLGPGPTRRENAAAQDHFRISHWLKPLSFSPKFLLLVSADELFAIFAKPILLGMILSAYICL